MKMKTFDEFFDCQIKTFGKTKEYENVFRWAKVVYEGNKLPSAIDLYINKTGLFSPYADRELVRKFAKQYAQYVLEYKMSTKNNVYNAVYYSGMGFLIGVMLTFLAMKHSESKQNDKQISATEQQNKYIQKMPNNTITFGVANQTKRQK